MYVPYVCLLNLFSLTIRFDSAISDSTQLRKRIRASGALRAKELAGGGPGSVELSRRIELNRRI